MDTADEAKKSDQEKIEMNTKKEAFTLHKNSFEMYKGMISDLEQLARSIEIFYNEKTHEGRQ